NLLNPTEEAISELIGAILSTPEQIENMKSFPSIYLSLLGYYQYSKLYKEHFGHYPIRIICDSFKDLEFNSDYDNRREFEGIGSIVSFEDLLEKILKRRELFVHKDADENT